MPSSLRNMTNHSFVPHDADCEEDKDLVQEPEPTSPSANQDLGTEERVEVHYNTVTDSLRVQLETEILENSKEIEVSLSAESSVESKTETKNTNTVKSSDSKAGRKPPPKKSSSKKMHGHETTLSEEDQKKLLEES